MSRHLTRVRQILPSQNKLICVSDSFSSSGCVGYLDRLEVVLEHAVFESPSMFLLSVSVGETVSPLSYNRFILSFPAFLGSIHGFPMMVLPLLRPMAFSSIPSLDCVQRICKDVDSSLNFVCVFLRGSRTLAASAANCPFFGMFQACKTLSCADCFAKFVQLDVAHLFQLALLLPR